MARANSNEAILGSATAGLVKVQLALYEKLMKHMPAAAADSDDWEELLRSILDPYLRITKQVDRFMAQDIRLCRQGQGQAARNHPS